MYERKIRGAAIGVLLHSKRIRRRTPYPTLPGFSGSIDLLQTLTYEGIPIFTDYDFYASRGGSAPATWRV